MVTIVLLFGLQQLTIGSFIPDHITRAIAGDGFFLVKCNKIVTFTAYSGKKDEATNNIDAITYLYNPILVVTA
jgi:hypothetical protein